MRRAALGLCLLAACAHRPLPPFERVLLSGNLVSIEIQSDDDVGQLKTLNELVRQALPALERWGGLHVPTRILVVPDHAALEAGAHRPGFPWLRAWARYDVVYLQSPRTWIFLHIPPTRAEQLSILTHELTHCAMYQAVSDGSDWARLEIPLWFREGMASWTAHEEGQRLPLAALRGLLRSHPDIDPLRQGAALYQHDQALVYSAGHWAFDALASQGVERVNDLMLEMRSGRSFDQSFQAAFGQTSDEFETALLKAWRGDPTRRM